jgi:membrane protease YdiL (CAAX protease family)
MSAQSVSPMQPKPAVRTQPTLSERPWWLRITGVFVVACALWILVGAIATAFFGPDYSFGSHTFRAAATCILVLAALALVLRWEGTRPSDYGVTVDRELPRGLYIGVASYFVPFLMAGSVVLMLNLAQIEVSTDLLAVVGQGFVLVLLVLLYEAIPEELIFRGYFFRVLSERLPVWATVIGQALLFTAFGFVVGAAVTAERALMFFLMSISLGYVRQITGTVYATIGVHAVFQLLAQWLLGDQWATLGVTDPGQWFALVALGLVPLALAPTIAAIIVHSRVVDR